MNCGFGRPTGVAACFFWSCAAAIRQIAQNGCIVSFSLHRQKGFPHSSFSFAVRISVCISNSGTAYQVEAPLGISATAVQFEVAEGLSAAPAVAKDTFTALPGANGFVRAFDPSVAPECGAAAFAAVLVSATAAFPLLSLFCVFSTALEATSSRIS